MATTNYQEAVDEAFVSRADVVEYLGLPSASVIEEILRDTLLTLALALVGDAAVGTGALAAFSERLAARQVDGRQARKVVLRALIGADAGLALGERGSPRKICSRSTPMPIPRR